MQPVEIYSRIKPLEFRQQQSCLSKYEQNNLCLNLPEQNLNKYGKNKKLIYSFKRVFDLYSKQSELFQEISIPSVQDLYNGINSLLIGYGANNSGKKFTIYGNENENGLLQSVLYEIFKLKDTQSSLRDTIMSNSSDTDETLLAQKVPNNQWYQKVKRTKSPFHTVYLSYIEILNDSVVDLLQETVEQESDCLVSKKNIKKKQSELNSFNEVQVNSYSDALQLIKWALENRSIGDNDLHLSHKILNIKLAHRYYSYTPNKKHNKSDVFMFSELSIVDLAYQNKNPNYSFRETESINASLMALRNCFEALKEKFSNEKNIPFRESNLTWLMKNYFKENSKIKMILCLNPSVPEFNQTCNVLKFANLVTEPETPKTNKPSPLRLKIDIPQSPKQKAELKNCEYEDYADEQQIDNIIQNNSFFSSQEKEAFEQIIEPSLNIDSNIDLLIECLNELKTKNTSLKLNEAFYKRIEDLAKDLVHYLGKNDLEKKKVINLTKCAQKETDLNNNYETESLTRISTIRVNDNIANTSRMSSRTSLANTDLTKIEFRNNNNDLSCTRDIPNETNNIRAKKITSQIKSTLRLSSSRHENFDLHNGFPVANRRGQKRSKSVDVWLDHKPQNLAKLDTLMQPIIGRKKSVKKIELKDTKRSSKYVLTHQQQDEYGEVVTNLIKGDIIKSPSGGSSVIFTDIERLQLKSPQMPRVRRPTNGLLEQNRFIIQDKCSVAIEGHPKVCRYKSIR